MFQALIGRTYQLMVTKHCREQHLASQVTQQQPPPSPGVCHNVRQRPSLQELHDDPELVSHQVAVVHLHHVVMVIVPHDHHLQLPRMGGG